MSDMHVPHVLNCHVTKCIRRSFCIFFPLIYGVRDTVLWNWVLIENLIIWGGSQKGCLFFLYLHGMWFDGSRPFCSIRCRYNFVSWKNLGQCVFMQRHNKTIFLLENCFSLLVWGSPLKSSELLNSNNFILSNCT